MILLYSSFWLELNHGINKEGVFEMLTKLEIEKEKIKLMGLKEYVNEKFGE